MGHCAYQESSSSTVGRQRREWQELIWKEPTHQQQRLLDPEEGPGQGRQSTDRNISTAVQWSPGPVGTSSSPRALVCALSKSKVKAKPGPGP